MQYTMWDAASEAWPSSCLSIFDQQLKSEKCANVDVEVAPTIEAITGVALSAWLVAIGARYSRLSQA